MQAVRIHGPKDVRFEEVPELEPKEDELLIKVKNVGVCRTDVELYIGDLKHYTDGYAKWPITPGHEWAGEIVAVGSGVKGFQRGERVTAETGIGCGACQLCRAGRANICPERIEIGIINWHGAMADYIRVPARAVHKLGELPFELGAMVEPAAVGTWAVRRARVAPADSVLVLGCGTIGLFCLQAAIAYGARFTCAVARSDHKLAIASQLGAAATINTAKQDFNERAMALTDGEGFDVVIEAAGSIPLLEQALGVLAFGGRMVIDGTFSGHLAQMDPDVIVTRELELYGALGGGTCYAEAIGLLQSGRYQGIPLITRREPLSFAPEAIRGLAEGELSREVKIMLVP